MADTPAGPVAAEVPLLVFDSAPGWLPVGRFKPGFTLGLGNSLGNDSIGMEPTECTAAARHGGLLMERPPAADGKRA